MRDKLQTGREYRENPEDPKNVDLAGRGTERSALRDLICREVATQCTSRWGTELRAVILTGSLARSEATFVLQEAAWKLMGDAEFMLIFHSHATLPPAADVLSAHQEIEQRLRQEGIEGRIDMSCVYPTYLQRLPPHIFSYELRCCGYVAWGDTQILSLIPGFSADEILPEDAWRLLCNRMIEVLECAPELTSDENPPSARLHYKILKLYLDMATSFLVFMRAYAPTYQERPKILRRLANERTQPEEYPFELGTLTDRVDDCTGQKLQWQCDTTYSPGLSWRDALQMAHSLWRWELARLAGVKERASDRQLFAQWMRIQPWGGRVRGWVYVLRASGWHKSYRHWPHWLRLAWKASPRYWIYFVASSILFQLTANESPSSRADWAPLGGLLPVRETSAKAQEQTSWESLAFDVFRNYQQFLMGTRS
jgi:hypothetical protein